jgi:hypothetical protein
MNRINHNGTRRSSNNNNNNGKIFYIIFLLAQEPSNNDFENAVIDLIPRVSHLEEGLRRVESKLTNLQTGQATLERYLRAIAQSFNINLPA